MDMTMLLLLTGFSLLVIWLYWMINRRLISSYILIIFPYNIIVLVNNLIATQGGFYFVTENTLLMILVGGLFFYLGSLVCSTTIGIRNRLEIEHEKEADSYYDTNRAKKYVSFVLLIRVVQLTLIFFRNGISRVVANDFEYLIARGLIGHLLISAFPLIPLLFYEWLLDKKNNKYSLFLVIVFVILAFVETEKAQVISIVIAIFFYCVFMNEQYIRKGSILLSALVIVLFVGNYAIKFLIQGHFSNVDNSYYFYRLWNYIAGSQINSRIVTDYGMHIPTNGLDYLIDVFLSFPNLIINGINGTMIGPDVIGDMPVIGNFLQVTTYNSGFMSQSGNVLSTIAYAYGNGDIFAFGCAMVFWGGMSEYVLQRMRRAVNDKYILTCCCFMSFSFLSFFGSYFTSASFTERLIYCALWTWLFSKDTRIIFHH